SSFSPTAAASPPPASAARSCSRSRAARARLRRRPPGGLSLGPAAFPALQTQCVTFLRTLAAFPSPLWGGVRGGGGAVLSRPALPSFTRTTPLPTPPPQAGEGVHRVCGESAPSSRLYPARLRSTKQAPPARRMLPHSVSAAARVSAPTRTWENGCGPRLRRVELKRAGSRPAGWGAEGLAEGAALERARARGEPRAGGRP